MRQHIFVNSHDLDTSMIFAQLLSGKGRYIDMPGTCFGYQFEPPQLQREKMPESIRDQIDDNWLDAMSLVKFSDEWEGDDQITQLVSSGITAADVEILNSMPDGLYVWQTRHVTEMFMNIDQIENASIVQLVSTGWEPYFKLILNHFVLDRGLGSFTDSIDSMLAEIDNIITATDRCALGLVEDGFEVVMCDYRTMFDADLFKTRVADRLGIEVDVNKNKRVLADYLEENLGAIATATDEQVEAFDSTQYQEVWDQIESPQILREMKRMFVSDKNFFTTPNSAGQRTAEGYIFQEPRDWCDRMADEISEFLDRFDFIKYEQYLQQ